MDEEWDKKMNKLQQENSKTQDKLAKEIGKATDTIAYNFKYLQKEIDELKAEIEILKNK